MYIPEPLIEGMRPKRETFELSPKERYEMFELIWKVESGKGTEAEKEEYDKLYWLTEEDKEYIKKAWTRRKNAGMDRD